MTRLPYEKSIEKLQQIGFLGEGEFPPMPKQRPQQSDPEPLGFSFYRTFVSEEDLSNLTLPRTFFGRSELSKTSFSNSDLSESTLCWNDFVSVDFSSALLPNSDMRSSLFQNCDFNHADLSNSDMRRSSFEGCTFRGANLKGAKLSSDQRLIIDLTEEQFSRIVWLPPGEEPAGG